MCFLTCYPLLPLLSPCHLLLADVKRTVSSRALYCQATPTYTIYDLITVMSCQTFKIVLCGEYMHLYNDLT
jgi:hypothetical protein